MRETFAETITGNLSLHKPPWWLPQPPLWNPLLFQGEEEPGMGILEPTALRGKAVEMGIFQGQSPSCSGVCA